MTNSYMIYEIRIVCHMLKCALHEIFSSNSRTNIRTSLVTVCTSNVYGSKVVDSVVVRCCVYVKRVRHQVWIILNTRLTIKVLLFV